LILQNSIKNYLKEIGLSRKRRKDLLRYAMRHYALLWAEPMEAAKALAREGPHITAKTLAALSKLAEFLGIEHEWSRRRRVLRRLLRGVLRNAGPGSGVPRYITVDSGFVESVLSIAVRLRERYRLFAAFLLATGLRVGEALEAYRAYRRLRRCRWGVPHLLILKNSSTKRAWLAMVTPELDEKLLAEERLGVSYARLREAWRRAANGLNGLYRLYDMRVAHATLLLEAGAPAWYIDMLQGRVGANILLQHYNAAEIRNLYEKWYLPALREPVLRLLQATPW